MRRWIEMAAKASIGVVFVQLGSDALTGPQKRADMAASFLEKARTVMPFLPENDEALVKVNAGVMVTGGILLMINRFPRLAAAALAGSMVATTLGGHAYWEIEDPEARKQNQIQALKNLAITGGLVVLAVERNVE